MRHRPKLDILEDIQVWYALCRAAECGQSARSFAGSEAGGVFEEAARLRVPDDDDHDIVLPHFQRVAISGEDTSGVSYRFLS
jgi:hypothetical protein